MIPRGQIDDKSLVYSGGVGEDASFEEALIASTGCQVWAFDPTPRAVAFARSIREPKFHFLPVGLWSADSVQRFYAPADEGHVSHSIGNLQDTESHFDAPCRSVTSVMSELGHERLNLLKLDIEGAEYAVLESLGDLRPGILCVEFHVVTSLWETIRFVRKLDYRPIHVDRWNVTFVA